MAVHNASVARARKGATRSYEKRPLGPSAFLQILAGTTKASSFGQRAPTIRSESGQELCRDMRSGPRNRKEHGLLMHTRVYG